MAPYISGECVISSVLSRCSKNLKQWMDQCYSSVLFRKQRKIHPQGVGVGQPEREASPWFNFGSTFYMFFLLPLRLPCINWASQEGCLFYLRFSLQSLDLPLFYFRRLFPSLSFSHHHSGLLFPILAT